MTKYVHNHSIISVRTASSHADQGCQPSVFRFLLNTGFFWEDLIWAIRFVSGMSLENIHDEILLFLYKNLPEDYSDSGEISRKILLKSINYKPRQIEKACKELESKGFVEFFNNVYHSEWVSIAITDEGLDYLEA
jgi:DNA-binding MarR family transcriptional regulator